MVKLKIARVAAASVASAGLIAGFSGVAFAYPSHHHDSSSNVVLTNTKTVSKNNVGVNNDVSQVATTGDALSLGLSGGSHHHHEDSSSSSTGGDAMSGDATNTTSFAVNGTVKNTGNTPSVVVPSSSSSDHGNNFTMTDTKTVSVNNVSVNNSVDQYAHSGEATTVGGNGGSATSGGAMNTNSSSVTFDVEN